MSDDLPANVNPRVVRDEDGTTWVEFGGYEWHGKTVPITRCTPERFREVVAQMDVLLRVDAQGRLPWEPGYTGLKA